MKMSCVEFRSSQPVTLVSKCTVFPDQSSAMEALKLSASDLPMLSCHYIQKGGLFTRPPVSMRNLIELLKRGLSTALTHFPPLACRLVTDSDGYVYIACNDAGVDFIYATASRIFVRDVLAPIDVPDVVKEFFSFDRTVSYDGHFKPVMAVQATELADGLFIGCAVNHAVADGTSFWNFFNTFLEVCRGVRNSSWSPDFGRSSVFNSSAVLKVPEGGPNVTFLADESLRERIFSFSREAILKLKAKANNRKYGEDGSDVAIEVLGKQSNDTWKGVPEELEDVKTKIGNWIRNAVWKPLSSEMESAVGISSFPSLCALLWQCVTRARKLSPSKTTTFRMAANCRNRLEPKLNPVYFGNAIQSIPTVAFVGDLLSRDLRWCAELLNRNVRAHDDAMVRRTVADWESDPRCFPLGNFDGATITMGSSPRLPMYDNDFEWGRPVSRRSGPANKFDGKISAFPGREGGGSVDLEVVLSPEAMAALESDPEFTAFALDN